MMLSCQPDLYILAPLAGILHTPTGQPVTVGELLALEAAKEIINRT